MHYRLARIKRIVLIISLLFVISAPVVFAQSSGRLKMKSAHREVADQPLIEVDQSTMKTSAPYRIDAPGFTSVQVNVNSSGQNIVGDAANEPSLAIDPTNPNRMVIGWRQFNTVTNSFRQAGYGYTTDGGATWTFPGVINPGIFRSDPVLDSDSEGNFYYNSLTSSSGLYTCKVYRSTDGGATWDTGVDAHGGDKQWMIIDKTGLTGNGNVYSYWTSYYSSCEPEFFTRSSDHGLFYEGCELIPEDPYWGTLAVGPEGELYIGGVAGMQYTGFTVSRSVNARDSGSVIGWDTTVLVSLDGDLTAADGPNPGGLLGQTHIAADHSYGPGRGYVYLLASVVRSSVSDPLDVMFSRSTDGGVTWDYPIRVNDDASLNNWQWFGTMSVAPTGRIDVVWLDTRDNPGTYLSSLYYAYSSDQGETWSPNFRLSDAFNPHLGWPQQDKMGDYFHMISDSGGAHLAWAATFGGEQNVYYGHITPVLVSIGETSGYFRPVQSQLSPNYPNPFNPSTTIQYELKQASKVTLKIYNLLGQEVRTLVNAQKLSGSHSVIWDGKNNHGQRVTSGVYFYRLQAGDFVKTRKMVLVK